MQGPTNVDIKLARKIIKSYKFICKFTSKSNRCYAEPNNKFIHIGYQTRSLNTFYSAVFHEIAHCLMFQEGKYYEYHNTKMYKKYTLNELKTIVKTAVKAEKAADKLMKNHIDLFLDLTYYGYSDEDIKDFKKYIVGYFKKLIREKKYAKK